MATPSVHMDPPAITPQNHEKWMLDLAHNEKAMLQDGTIHIRDSETFRTRLCQKQTESFTLELRAKVTRLVTIFNQAKGNSTNPIKMFKIAGSHLDFMVFRNTLKLVFTTPKVGTIDIYFSSYLESAKPTEDNPYVSGERLELTFGPFDHPYWHVKNERFDTDNMIQKFLMDFVLMSCQ